MTTRASLVAVLALSGCARIAPGLHLHEGAVSARAAAAQDIALVPITPALVAEQSAERARAAAARPRDPLAAAGEPGAYAYRVAPHDVLSVTVWDHPELTIPAGEYRAPELAGHVVQADGTIFYPHVGVVAVAGKTLPEIREVLTERLRRYVEVPQLDVRVAAFRGKRVQVTGEVVQPATVAITDVPLRVHDALGAARGLTAGAWYGGVTLTRAGKAHRIDLEAMYLDGDASQNWLLQDGDLLHVPGREQNKVFVLGEVRRPASKPMARGRMSLADAIGDAEGFDPVTSNPGEIYVLRGPSAAARVFKLDASSADALILATAFQLEPRDVVFVSPYRLTNWNRVVQQLLPTIQGIWQTVDIGNRTATALGGN